MSLTFIQILYILVFQAHDKKTHKIPMGWFDTKAMAMSYMNLKKKKESLDTFSHTASTPLLADL